MSILDDRATVTRGMIERTLTTKAPMAIEGEASHRAIVASAEPAAGAQPSPSAPQFAACRNCSATLSGEYCASCGQAANVHRTFESLAHDILHSALHFEGKFWRTIPELVLHPGRLTRRYIEGERAKFVSPMALFLFTVFLLYAVFAFFPASPLPGPASGNPLPDSGGLARAIDFTEQTLGGLRRELASSGLSAARRTA